ncbi:MAG TPA: 2-hydroxyacid dehydrogenase [Stellaceae bacterium]|jgi:lactate dehydrogenase-like 2-hydroxyacid dehydrogenase|nr:2-hydroxyacid dehydrogenase [Stellaceae bacterium]
MKPATVPEIVIVGPMYPATQARLEAEFTAHRLWEATDQTALLRQVSERVRGIAVYALHGCAATIIEALPRLEIIACMGIGVDRIDLACAAARGVRVTNTPDVVTDDTADIAMALMLAVERRIAAGDRFVRRGDWQHGELPFGRALRGRRLGIVGLGRIGQAIAVRAAAFGMEIAYQGPRPKPALPYRYIPDVVALAEWAEIIAIACPGGEATRHLVNRAVIEALGPSGTLINIARGSVVDEAALVIALQTGTLGAAGLDVYASEPHVPEALWAMDNVVLSPHTGSATDDTRHAMGDLVVDNLLAHFAGRPLLTPV